MQEKYRKIMVAMEPETASLPFGKRTAAAPVCYVESYKGKRAVFFHGYHFFPGGKYHLILIGNGHDGMKYQDFGPLHAEGNGELQCYQTFEGVPLECYAFCLLCTEAEDGGMTILYKGKLFQETSPWEQLCDQGKQIEAFTAGCDETRALWYRLERLDLIPEEGKPCQTWMERYGHCIIGRNGGRYFLGVPGRFLQKEQPLREEGVFLLWQPMRGGEAFFDRPDAMTRRQQEGIFGYWIAEVNLEKGCLQGI